MFTARSLFSCPSSPTLLPQGEKGANTLSDYASLIEPTWLPHRCFEWPLGCSSPCQGGVGEGGHGPIHQSARHIPTLPLQRGGGKAEGSPVAWQSGITRTVLLPSGVPSRQKNGARGVPRAPQADGVLRCWI